MINSSCQEQRNPEVENILHVFRNEKNVNVVVRLINVDVASRVGVRSMKMTGGAGRLQRTRLASLFVSRLKQDRQNNQD